MTKARTRLKSAAAPAPQTPEQVDAAIARIGVLQRERERIATAMNEELAAVKAAAEARAKPLGEEIAALASGVQAWCESHREDLTKGGRIKTHRFGAGSVNWRARPPKVSIRGVEKVLEDMMRLGLSRFIRTKMEPNKEAMLAEPDVAAAITGVKIGSAGEDFVIRPFETELEEVA